MFSARFDKSTETFVLTPKWGKDGDKTIEFTYFKVIDSDNYVLVVFDNAHARRCQEWVKIGGSGEYKDIEVKDAVVVLRLVAKEHEMYDKKIMPTIWDTVLIREFKSLLEISPNGGFFGKLKCSNNENTLIEIYEREGTSEEKKRHLKDEFLSTAANLDPSTQTEKFKFFSINTENNSGSFKKAVSTKERLEEKYEWIEEKLSLHAFGDVDHTLIESIQKGVDIQYLDIIKSLMR